jgi:hypothetical protein
MPYKIVQTDGNTPLIPGDSNRMVLTLQNNNATDIRWRPGAAVALDSPTQQGLKMYANGGRETLTGVAAQQAIYAVQDGTPVGTMKLDYVELIS